MGNSSIIYPVLLRTFKFTLRDGQFNDLIQPVTRDVLKDFMDILRKKVSENGGPSTSDRFMKFTHVNRTKVTKICTRHRTVEASSSRAQPRILGVLT
jgi:hypothetical protein